MSKHILNFIYVTRLNKPIGFLLLFWPCSWGLSLALYFDKNFTIFFYYLILFFFGSVLMRSAGCIVNDIVDEKIDKKVERTKDRPIASGKLNKSLAWVYVLILCTLALLVLIQFNFLTISLGAFSMIFAFSYPFMKRFTYWPQLFLGFTFNYGLIMAWFSIKPEFSYIPIIFYIGAIFWTLAYDTIYGFQDIKDDEIIGVKSTSIKFKKNPKLLIFICYSVFIFMQIISGLLMKFNYYYYIGIVIIAVHLLFYQTKNLDISNPKICLEKFKANNFLGLIVFVNILTNKIYL